MSVAHPSIAIQSSSEIVERAALLGRNRALRMIGAAGLAVVGVITRPGPAHASHGGSHPGSPYPCYGYPACPSCYNGVPTGSYQNLVGYCPSANRQCWYTCGTNGRLYRCCDFIVNGQPCICSYCGSCGPGC